MSMLISLKFLESIVREGSAFLTAKSTGKAILSSSNSILT